MTRSGNDAPVRVMLCDDSAAARAAMARTLEADPEIRVVARAGNGQQALTMLAMLPVQRQPDVVLLDLEMPVMDGMTMLQILMQRGGPRPAVVVASALTQRGAAAAMAALRAGAVDYLPKPSACGMEAHGPAFAEELLAKIKGWAGMRRRGADRRLTERRGVVSTAALGASTRTAPRAVAIGCSTGGPQALAALVRCLPRLSVPILVVQHMPAGFTAMLADHLGRLAGVPCAEAQDGLEMLPGHLYLAPGNRHLLVELGPSGGLIGRLSDLPPENFCRPAVDPLLRSLVAACGGAMVAVVLTGMGHDGLAGCQLVAASGGLVLAQDEASSVVWGMPGAVARAGLASALLPPELLADRIASAIMRA